MLRHVLSKLASPYPSPLAGLLFALLAAVPPIAIVASAGFVTSVVTRAMILAIAAIALDFIVGIGGMISLGHAAFIGIGAYSVGILAAHGVSELSSQVGLALAASAAFALVTGAISLRTVGVYFIMITLAFGQMLYFLATSLAVYGGDDGLSLPHRSLVAGSGFLQNDLHFFYVVLACLIASYLLLGSMARARFGRVLRGIRENAIRTEAVGFNPFKFQLAAYVISGMVASIAGVLLANHVEFASPSYLNWQRSGELLIVVILGGLATLHGAILGALTFVLLEEVLSHVTRHWMMIFGPALVLIVLVSRGGLVGLLRGASKK